MTIVTIDFDIIMEPCINLYNDLIDETTSCRILEKKFPQLEGAVTSNLSIYEYLTRYIMSCCKKLPANKIIFVNDHEQVVSHLPKAPMKIDVVNIDHHHDICYDEDDLDAALTEGTCANWVKWMSDMGRLGSYQWIHNNQPDLKLFAKARKLLTNHYYLKDYNLNSLVDKTDMLIICFSQEWIPSEYQPLFMTWQTICEITNDVDYIVE